MAGIQLVGVTPSGTFGVATGDIAVLSRERVRGTMPVSARGRIATEAW